MFIGGDRLSRPSIVNVIWCVVFEAVLPSPDDTWCFQLFLVNDATHIDATPHTRCAVCILPRSPTAWPIACLADDIWSWY